MLGQQVFLAKRMSKKRIIAETSAGQHDVATTIVGYSFRFRVCGVYGETGWMCIVKCPMLSVYGLSAKVRTVKERVLVLYKGCNE